MKENISININNNINENIYLTITMIIRKNFVILTLLYKPFCSIQHLSIPFIISIIPDTYSVKIIEILLCRCADSKY